MIRPAGIDSICCPIRLPLLSKDEVHIWYVPLVINSDKVGTLDAVLSDDERDRAGRFVFERHRVQYTLARGFLRCLLGGYLKTAPADIRFSYGVFGKPELAGRHSLELRFNLSHAGDWAACAISINHEVGIDIEPVSSSVPWEELAPEVFSLNEQAEFAAIPPHEKAATFLQGWTRKEAYVKGCGQGLSLPLGSFDVPLNLSAGPSPIRLPSVGETAPIEWWLYSVDLSKDLVAALAVEGHPVQLEVFRWSRAGWP